MGREVFTPIIETRNTIREQFVESARLVSPGYRIILGTMVGLVGMSLSQLKEPKDKEGLLGWAMVLTGGTVFLDGLYKSWKNKNAAAERMTSAGTVGMSTSMTTSSSSSHPKNIFAGGRMIGMSTSTTTSSSASHPQGMYQTY
jgi:hypothetical protein